MAVTECRVACIRPIMVTGDRKLTGLTIIAVASSVLWFEEARKLAVRLRRANSLVIGNL